MKLERGLCFIYSVKLTTITAKVKFLNVELNKEKAKNLSLFDQAQ